MTIRNPRSYSRMLGVAALCLSVAQVEASAATACFRGINLSGAEFGELGGKVDTAYTWPSQDTVDYFAAKGFDTVRLPFMWERLQPKLRKPFDKDEFERLRSAVKMIRDHNMRVILDPHNYARYQKKLIGSKAVPSAAFADLWTRLAKEYKDDDGVIFGLMNEPAKIPIAQWFKGADAATKAIRKAGATNLILVPGTAWTGAHSWLEPIDGEPNGTAMARLKDPGRNMAFEVHQYFDDDFSGTKGNCSRADDAVAAIVNFTGWLRKTGNRGFLGEFGVPASEPACIDGLKAMVDVVEENKDVWVGWTYWVAGHWWPKDEPLNIQPTEDGDRPQLAGLTPALSDFSAQGMDCPSLNR